MDSIEAIVNKSAEGIINRTGISSSVAKRVAECLLNTLKEKETNRLIREDVLRIGEALSIGGQGSYQTWLHQDFLNNLIYELKKTGSIESPYFNIPQQVKRYLIAYIDREIWKNIVFIQSLRDDLLSLKTESFNDLSDEEEECICSFIASSALFANIVFPGFERSLLLLKWKDVSLESVYIEIPFNIHDDREDGVFYRYHLPPPASIYFLRCILFYKKHHRKFGLKKLLSPNSYLFTPMQDRINKIPYIFKNWLIKRQSKLGLKESEGLTISSFRESAVMTSLIDTIANKEQKTFLMPFLAAIQSRMIVSDSFHRRYFLTMTNGSDYSNKKDIGNKNIKKLQLDQNIKGLKDEIDKIINTLRRLKRDSNLKERKTYSVEIKNVLNKSQLHDTDLENISLYIEWISQMLHPTHRRTRRPSTKTILNYATSVRRLLLQIAGSGAISSMDKDALTTAIYTTMKEYNSKSIKTGLKSFTDFLTAHLDNNFSPPNWRSKELRKDDISTQKPLIHFDNVSRAIDRCKDFFCAYTKGYKDDVKRKDREDEAHYKALTIRHMINLGFYAGIRASEFAHLKISNIIYDNGLVICIRTTKTSNGVRNIPINLLAPDQYLNDFMEYFENRRTTVTSFNEYLFPCYRDKDSPWDTSHLASEVSRLFASIGVMEIRFHHLRHAFANWFLMRWFFAFYREYLSEELPFLKHELFQEPYIDRLKQLILGLNNKEGQDTFTHALAVLARLIGHGGPMVTFQKYIHSSDWLFYLLSRSMNKSEIQITSQQAQGLLQLSYPSLPKEFKGRGKKTVLFHDIMNQQKYMITRKLK